MYAHTHTYHLHSFSFSLLTDTVIWFEICKQHISMCIIQNVPLYHYLRDRWQCAAELKLKDCVLCREESALKQSVATYTQ